MQEVDISQLDNVPITLRKSIGPYVQRAADLRKAGHRVMEYWCTLYAATVGSRKTPRLEAEEVYLNCLISRLEEIRRQESSTQAITHQMTAQVYVEDFALTVFEAADSEDREGKANRDTAKKYLASAYFLTLLSLPDLGKDTSEAIEAKIVYAKYKANDIIKALRENRTPVSGNPFAPPSSLSKLDLAPSDAKSKEGADEDLVASSKRPTSPGDQEKRPQELQRTSSDSESEILKSLLEAPPKHETSSDSTEALGKHPDASTTMTPIDNTMKAGPDMNALDQAERAAKYAIQAITYDDVEEAKKQLRRALQLLET